MRPAMLMIPAFGTAFSVRRDLLLEILALRTRRSDTSFSFRARRQNRLEGRNMLLFEHDTRTCECDSDRRRSIGESQAFVTFR